MSKDLISTCVSLARWAESGSREVDGLLVDGIMQNDRADFSQLRPLSDALHQLRDEAQRLQNALDDAPTLSPKLQTVLSAHLAECDGAGAVITKQLMRLTRDTPTEVINTAALLKYDSFLRTVTRFLLFAMRPLQQDSQLQQEAQLEDEDAVLLMVRIGLLCRDIGKSGGILLETPSTHYSFVSKEAFDAQPPAYEAPPPFQESSNHGRSGSHTAPAMGSGSSANKDQSRPGFMGLLTKPFRAATDVLRPKPEPLVMPLCQAAARGSVAQLRFMLSEGANINGRDEDGQTALIRAIDANQLGAVEFLLKAGADHRVCNSGSGGKPPLFYAVDAENGGAIDLLLEYGASANQRNDWGEPYLAGAIKGATPPEWIELLLSRGADANLTDHGLQPLVVLALKKRKRDADREEVARLLLRHGARPDTRDAGGTPLLHHCVAQRRDGLVRHLLELGADPNASDVHGTPLLVVAAVAKQQPPPSPQNRALLVQMLLEHGADANAYDIYLTHILLLVLEDGKLAPAEKAALMELLLRHGAKPQKAKDVWNVTLLEKALGPFLAAVEGGGGGGGGGGKGTTAATTTTTTTPDHHHHLLEIPELLLQYGADPDQRLSSRKKKTKDGSRRPTLLTYALEQARGGGGGRDLAELALRYGADANLADDVGDDEKKNRTPLALAVRSGDRRLVEMLLEKGARGAVSLDEMRQD